MAAIIGVRGYSWVMNDYFDLNSQMTMKSMHRSPRKCNLNERTRLELLLLKYHRLALWSGSPYRVKRTGLLSFTLAASREKALLHHQPINRVL